MPDPMNKSSFNSLSKEVDNSYNYIAEASMNVAAKEVRIISLKKNYNDRIIVDEDISGDGAWQKRGYSSLNGFITIISKTNGKSIDYRILSKKCKSCEDWNAHQDSSKYMMFKDNHVCSINHKRLAGSMEAKGIVECFQSSIEERKLRYARYIGDGDSSSYPAILAANPYPGQTVEKDKKSLGGKGRLTEKEINKIQNYYDIAIRQNIDNLYQMRKNILAVLHHSCMADSFDARHILSPKTKDSWCNYQRSKFQNKDYKEKLGLPNAIKTFIKPVLSNLMSEDLLSKSLHGSTQNNNESLNALIWKHCLKDVYVGIDVLNLGCCSATINFNDALNGIIRVFEKLYLKPGHYSSSFFASFDLKIFKNMD
ncbi:uncharacterized protein LOC136093725 [Hydra vulgaris]|uniref:uncharacterized protein LOC136093725 n=1 Tax=Hydra vulgaris TaxID=6087 RepID=UPI0032EA092D